MLEQANSIINPIMKKGYRIVVFCIFFIVHGNPGMFAQSSVAKAQAVFLYNFTLNIEWPLDYRKGDFVIGVYGPADVINELTSYLKDKTVGNQPFKVVKYNTLENIGRCHILFIPFGKSNEMPAIIGRIGNNRTLLVGEKNGIIQAGAAVNFLVVDDRLKFELKPANASKYGLKVLSQLEKLADKKY
jgi:hypothetical protein